MGMRKGRFALHLTTHRTTPHDTHYTHYTLHTTHYTTPLHTTYNHTNLVKLGSKILGDNLGGVGVRGSDCREGDGWEDAGGVDAVADFDAVGVEIRFGEHEVVYVVVLVGLVAALGSLVCKEAHAHPRGRMGECAIGYHYSGGWCDT